MKDDTLYKALYCGVCKSIGGTCGQVARFSLTYDIAFLSAIAHNIVNCDVEIKKSRCVVHPIISRPIAKRDKLSDQLADVNVILAYYKLRDDVNDDGKGRLRSVFLKGGYKRAKKRNEKIDEIVSLNYKSLFELEKSGCASVDVACDPFALMLEELSKEVLGKFSTPYTEKLFYNIGKWIYLIDALDDYDKDIKKNDYNVLRLAYGAKSAKELLGANEEELRFLFEVIFRELASALNEIKFYFNRDLVVNIVTRGLPAKTAEIIRRINKNA